MKDWYTKVLHSFCNNFHCSLLSMMQFIFKFEINLQYASIKLDDNNRDIISMYCLSLNTYSYVWRQPNRNDNAKCDQRKTIFSFLIHNYTFTFLIYSTLNLICTLIFTKIKHCICSVHNKLYIQLNTAFFISDIAALVSQIESESQTSWL